MASDVIKVTLDPNGIDRIVEIIAHLKQRNDELTAALTAVQEECDRQLEELRNFRRPVSTTALPHCVCGWCKNRRDETNKRGGYAGAEQE